MEITSVERNGKNKDKLSVYIDGKYSFSIQEDDFLRLSLYTKHEITLEEINYIKNTLNLRAAKSTAIKYLALKLRSEKDVRNKLRDEGFDEDVIDKATEDIKSIGYINDEIYAQKYVHDRSVLKPKSKRLLRYELQNKGVSGDIIDTVLDNWDVDELAVALGLARKRFGKYDVTDPKIIKKIYSFLQHRGYTYEVIENVIQNLETNI